MNGSFEERAQQWGEHPCAGPRFDEFEKLDVKSLTHQINQVILRHYDPNAWKLVQISNNDFENIEWTGK